MTHWLSTIMQAFARPLQWWVVVAPWEQGLRVRLGKSSKFMLPGLHFRIPFLDRVYVVGTRMRMVETNNQTVTTKDGKTLTLSFGLSYSVANAQLLFDSLTMPETTLLNQASAAIAAEIWTRDLADCKPATLQAKATSAVAAAGEEWGLADLSVCILSFAAVRTFRLLQNDYRSFGGLNTLDEDEQRRMHR